LTTNLILVSSDLCYIFSITNWRENAAAVCSWYLTTTTDNKISSV